MKHRPHSVWNLISHSALTAGSFGAGCVFSWCGILQLYPFHSTIFFLLALHSLMFGISAFASCWYSVQYLAASVWLEEAGMSKKRFGKTVVFLPWSEIRFAGICTQYSPQGEKKRYCFAPWTLNQEEQKKLDSVAEKVIYFSSLNCEELAYIKAHCPLEISTGAEQFLRHEKKCGFRQKYGSFIGGRQQAADNIADAFFLCSKSQQSPFIVPYQKTQCENEAAAFLHWVFILVSEHSVPEHQSRKNARLFLGCQSRFNDEYRTGKTITSINFVTFP